MKKIANAGFYIDFPKYDTAVGPFLNQQQVEESLRKYIAIDAVKELPSIVTEPADRKILSPQGFWKMIQETKDMTLNINKKAIFKLAKLADRLDQLGFLKEAAILDRIITDEEYGLVQQKAILVLWRSGWNEDKISEALQLPVEEVKQAIEADRLSSKEISDVIEHNMA